MHYFTFFAHTSQYLSIRVMSSSTLNKASWVATLPQCAQNFVLPLCLTNGPNDVNLFSTWFSSRESQQVQFLQYYSLFFTNQNCLIYKNTIRHCCRQIIYRHFAWHWPLFLVRQGLRISIELICIATVNHNGFASRRLMKNLRRLLVIVMRW
jgi:hypothetical protein